MRISRPSALFTWLWCPQNAARWLVAGQNAWETSSPMWSPKRGRGLIELETMPDHGHLLVEVGLRFGVHELARAIKGRSSRLLRDEFSLLLWRLPSLWTNWYFVATVGGAPFSAFKRYVEAQKD